ncbi:MAG: cytochrome b/b6 domain-containing protein [Candidatus Accumulibacter sp.]|jgi:cytochrome b561|nr:cytochrome b/b6 domain-containing protein [Accumulibacter sp.]
MKFLSSILAPILAPILAQILARRASAMNAATGERHHPLIRVLHWLVAGLIVAALTMSTLVMSGIPDSAPEKIDALRRHMSIGSLVFVLTLLRFIMRRAAKIPPPLSSGMAWADWLARVVHRVFDVLILVMIASGAGMALLAGLPRVVFLGYGHLPDLSELPLLIVHRSAAIALFACLVLHVGGALFHQFILRDNLFSRMCFPLPRRMRETRSETIAGTGP